MTLGYFNPRILMDVDGGGSTLQPSRKFSVKYVDSET